MQSRTVIPVILCLLLTLTVGPVSAQNRFFEEGEGGITAAVGGGTGENYTTLVGFFNYTIASRLDLGLGVSRASLDDKVIGNDGSGRGYSPMAAFALVRPSSVSNFGVDVTFQYTTETFSSDGLDALNLDMTSTGWFAGGILYLRLEHSPGVTIYPAISIAHVNGTTKIEDALGETLEESVEDVAMGLEVSLFIEEKFFIRPSFESIDGNDTWGMTAGFVFAGM